MILQGLSIHYLYSSDHTIFKVLPDYTCASNNGLSGNIVPQLSDETLGPQKCYLLFGHLHDLDLQSYFISP